jgi:hypothetical protein
MPEAAAEIVTDKVVASADRLARRGTLRLSDLYDLWHLALRVGAEPPSGELVRAKLGDHGQVPRGADPAAAVRAVSPEELRSVLGGLLPAHDLAGLDPEAILCAAASVMKRYRDVV